MSTVIVAIPAKDDIVWRLSSEKIPHMTLLYLGDLTVDEQQTALEFVEHAVNTSLRRFGMSVDRRGTLGDKDADVLFFEQTWSEDIKSFVGYLLQEDRIKTAFSSIEQFEGWTPHLTLGYPEAPAKADDRDYPGVHYVHFDKIAVWTGDYEGPEFELKTNTDMELMMSATTEQILTGEVRIGKYLKQYGVKGMRWGVRKDRKEQNAKFGGKQKHEFSPDGKKARDLKKKPVHALSNKEIEELNKRLRLEKNLRELDPDVVAKGKKNVDRILDTVKTGVQVMNSPLGKTAITIGSLAVGKGLAAKGSKGASDAFLDRLKEL